MKPLTLIAALILLFSFGCTDNNTNKGEIQKENVKRYGWVIQVKSEKLDYYKTLHANPWPQVNKMLKECNIQNYSIYYRDGLLFSYLEYTGTDFDADMKKMADDSTTRRWWKETDACQEPVHSAKEGVWWADMEEVFHLE